MDNRKAQCKFLKKEYRKERRHATWLWVSLWCLSLAVILFAGVCYACVQFYDSAFMDSIRKVLDLSPVLKFEALITRYAPWTALGGAVVWLVSLIGWVCACRRVRRGETYLEWRTVKTMLEAEKEEKK